MSGPEPSKLERQARDALDRLPGSAAGVEDATGSVSHDIIGVEPLCETRPRVDVYRAPREIPPEVHEFISNFDCGDYPDLVQQ